jgi:type IV pilus assembly protein PilA
VKYNGAAGGISQFNGTAYEITFTPNVAGAALGNTPGNIDWGCASATNATATANGIAVVAPATNPMPAKWVPTQCK